MVICYSGELMFEAAKDIGVSVCRSEIFEKMFRLDIFYSHKELSG